jgi:UDP-glucose:(heptosyl)LPS alpha-1,3-glucosyltransferase
VFVRQHFSQFGGGELMLARLIRALIDRGTDVTIIARSWPKEPDALKVVRCDPPRIARAIREPLFARAACQLVAEQAGALVQAHERIPCCDIYRAGEGVHAAYLERRRRTEGMPRRLSLALSPYHRNLLRLERKMFQSSRLKAVIAISKMVADDIVRHYDVDADRIHHIPNGIDLDRFTLEVRGRMRAPVRAKMGTPADRQVLLFVGSDYRRKGLGAAIEALARSKSEAELWVVGQDKDADMFSRLAERSGLGNRFRLVGAQTDPVPYYAAADVVILASQYDPFGSVVIEGLACGLPVVTSLDTGGKEAAEKLDPLLVCDASEIDNLTRSIERAFELAVLPSTALAARAIAEDYGIDRMVDRMLSLYAGLAAQAG